MDLDNWKKAGKIGHEALMYGKSLIKPGVKLLDVAEKVENFIRDHGAQPAFPVNLSINEIAAHYSPVINDKLTFKKNHVVKIDVGANYKSCLADNAATVDLSGKYSDLVDAVEQSLNAAIKAVKPGVYTSDIGKAIEETLLIRGYQPIRNLGGHQMEENNLHAGLFIPNQDDETKIKIKKGMILAIEPFAAKKSEWIKDKGDATILSIENHNAIYNYSPEFLDIINNYKFTPFTLRWLNNQSDNFETWLNPITDLDKKGQIHGYRQLVSEKGDVVVQAEHTIFVDDEAIILTA